MRSILFVMTLLLLASCSSKDSAVIKVDVAGGSNKEVVVSKLNVNTISVLDTLKLDGNGSAKYKVEVAEDAPEFFYLSMNQKRLASLLVKGGENVTVAVDTAGNNFSVSGSEESQILAQMEKSIYDATAKFDAISEELVKAVEANDKKAVQQLSTDLSKFFVQCKRSALNDIMKNTKSLASITLLYHKFGEELPLFGDVHDLVYFRTLYDSLQKTYPNSVYVKSLKEEVARYQKAFEFNNKMTLANELAFPEISLPDTKGEVRKMSELLGKPFMLIFWTSTNAEQKMYNHEIKKLYAKYHPKGLEIYQVSADVDKTLWATVVKEQELPWINVCDGRGTASVALGTYAINQLPTMFIFDKEGNVVAKDVFDIASLERTLGKLSY